MIDKNIVKFVEMFDMLEQAIKLARMECANWDTIYHMLFSLDFGLFQKMQAIHRIDYYDPDASYEEDVLAYYNAAKPVAEMFRKLAKADF